jgi:hypothetical protein
MRLDTETILDERQMAIEFAEKLGKKPVILEGNHDSLVGG